MKRFFAVIALSALVLAALFARPASEVQNTVNVMALKGPTGMGLSKLMADSAAGETGSNIYNFTLTGAVDEVTAKLVKGEADIAAVPANLASVLYNKTGGEIQVLAVNTLGVIYILEKGDTIHSVEDLRGRTIYASGKGATPEYSLNYILMAHGIDPVKDVDIQYKSEHAECAAVLAANDGAVAMLPEPFVTTSRMNNPEVRIALDLTKEWNDLQTTEGSALLTGVIVARKAWVEDNPYAVSLFMNQYKASVEFVNSDIDRAAGIIGSFGIVAEAVARQAIPRCNIVFIEGDRMKAALGGYLGELFAQNPASVGGKLPEDDFYFKR